jgi:tetratricopeptide (TPR) repeat protein
MKSMTAAVVATFVALNWHLVALAESDPVPSGSPPQSQKAFNAGTKLMEQGKYCEALGRYKDALALSPDDSSVLYDAGLAAYQCKDYVAAVKLWEHLKAIDPEDWQVRAKLIQSYQALGDLAARDAERLGLLELRKQGHNEELSRQVQFCREQFEAGGERLMVFEQFELKGERALRYVFIVLTEKEHAEKYRISLGSYDFTNEVWHQTTKPTPKESDRLFHLDGYYDWGHATYGMYFPEPSYDEVRKIVIEILEHKREPVSGTRIGDPRGK